MDDLITLSQFAAQFSEDIDASGDPIEEIALFLEEEMNIDERTQLARALRDTAALSDQERAQRLDLAGWVWGPEDEAEEAAFLRDLAVFADELNAQ